jgi:transketolase
MTDAQLDQLSVNCIRTLSMDAVQQAKSGHPGTPMALAPLVYTLWNRVMRFAGVVVHEDTWKAGPDVTIREHEGRGYWKGGVWTSW